MNSHATTTGVRHDQGQRQPAQDARAPRGTTRPTRPRRRGRVQPPRAGATPPLRLKADQHDRCGEGGGEGAAGQPARRRRRHGLGATWSGRVTPRPSAAPRPAVGGSSMPGCRPRAAGSSAAALIGGSFGRPPLLVPSVRYQCSHSCRRDPSCASPPRGEKGGRGAGRADVWRPGSGAATSSELAADGQRSCRPEAMPAKGHAEGAPSRSAVGDDGRERRGRPRRRPSTRTGDPHGHGRGPVRRLAGGRRAGGAAPRTLGRSITAVGARPCPARPRSAPDDAVHYGLRVTAGYAWRLVVVAVAVYLVFVVLGDAHLRGRRGLRGSGDHGAAAAARRPAAGASVPRGVAVLSSLLLTLLALGGVVTFIANSVAGQSARLSAQFAHGLADLETLPGGGAVPPARSRPGPSRASRPAAGSPPTPPRSRARLSAVRVSRRSCSPAWPSPSSARCSSWPRASASGRGCPSSSAPAPTAGTRRHGRAGRRFAGYTRGVVVIAATNAVLVGVALLLLRVPLALPLALLVFFAAFVPARSGRRSPWPSPRWWRWPRGGRSSRSWWSCSPWSSARSRGTSCTRWS